MNRGKGERYVVRAQWNTTCNFNWMPLFNENLCSAYILNFSTLRFNISADMGFIELVSIPLEKRKSMSHEWLCKLIWANEWAYMRYGHWAYTCVSVRYTASLSKLLNNCNRSPKRPKMCALWPNILWQKLFKSVDKWVMILNQFCFGNKTYSIRITQTHRVIRSHCAFTLFMGKMWPLTTFIRFSSPKPHNYFVYIEMLFVSCVLFPRMSLGVSSIIFSCIIRQFNRYFMMYSRRWVRKRMRKSE